MSTELLGELLSVAMFLTTIAAVMAGYPVAFTLAGVGLFFAALGMVVGVFDTAILSALAEQVRHLYSKLEREKQIFSALPKLSSAIVDLAREHGRVTMADAIRLTGSNRNTLKLHFRKLVHQGQLQRHGMGAGVWYQPR